MPTTPPARCTCAHPDDTSPCSGPASVRVADVLGVERDGCIHHAARALAGIPGSTVRPLSGHSGAAIQAYRLADAVREGRR